MPLTFEVTIDDIRMKYLRIDSEADREMEFIKVIVPFEFLTNTNDVWKSSEKTFWERVHPQSRDNPFAFELSEEDAEWLKDFVARCKKQIMEREGIA